MNSKLPYYLFCFLISWKHELNADTKLPLVVEIVNVAYQNSFELDASYTGLLKARRSSQLGFPRAGRVVEVSVDEGMQVKKDELLAKLDSRALHSQRRQLHAKLALRQAQVLESQANLTLAQDRHHRFKVLLRTKTTSRQEYDTASAQQQTMQARLTVAEKEVMQARAALELNKILIQDRQLHAPYAGTIIQRQIDEGTFVAAGTPVLSMLETGVLEAWIGIPASAINSLEMNHLYHLEQENKQYSARLLRIIPSHDPQTLTLTAIFELTEAHNTLFAGQMVSLKIAKTVAERGVWLPLTALKRGEHGLWQLYRIQTDKGNPEILSISSSVCRILHHTTERAYVRGALQEGERIVASGIHRLVPRQQVRIINTTSKQPH